MNNTVERICEIARRLPEPLAKEALEFIESIGTEYHEGDATTRDLKRLQASAMEKVWANQEDDIWNDL